MMEWMAADRYFPHPLERISHQIAFIGAVICNFLGAKYSFDDLMMNPQPTDRKGPSGAELERRLLAWAGAAGRSMTKRGR